LIKCLLTEWEGQTEKYLFRDQDVRTARSEVRPDGLIVGS